MYDLKLLWWQDSIKSSQAIICVRWLKETDVSRTISVFIIRDDVEVPDDEVRDGPRNGGFLYSSDAADCLRRLY
jgi:hypothetical protein